MGKPSAFREEFLLHQIQGFLGPGEPRPSARQLWLWPHGDWTVLLQSDGTLDQFWTVGVKKMVGDVMHGAWARVPGLRDIDVVDGIRQLVAAAVAVPQWVEPAETAVKWQPTTRRRP